MLQGPPEATNPPPRQLLWAVLVLAAFAFAPSWAAEPGPDVRVVIDISGSMKQNDPANLRIPAVKLLSQLLPSNSHAGIWTFGQYVNELVPLAPVSPAWHQQAVAGADQISSRGLFTNIGLALERSSRGWQEPASRPRHLILLTDGVVDVSKQAADNAAAKADLLARVLPAIKASGAQLHTIALSASSDMALLQQLSRETNGVHERAETADDLNRIFLRLFEQAAPRDSLPLSENRFEVDASIDEITVLVFRKAGATPAKLQAPDGSSHSVEAHPADWRWHSEASYDLITINKPAPGSWQIVAEVDPDNRVLVVSKLGLQVNAVPVLALAGEKLQLALAITEDGKPITRADFLKLVTAQVTLKAPQPAPGFERQLALVDQGNGRYRVEWEVPALDTQYQISFTARAPTFERTRQFSLQAVATPVQANASVDEHQVASARFEVGADMFKEGSISIIAEREGPDGKRSPQPVTGSGLSWSASVPATGDGRYQLHWRFEALTVAGRPIALTGTPLGWQIGAAINETAPAEAPAHEAPAEASSGDAEHAAEPEHPAEPESAEPGTDAAHESAHEAGGLPWLWIGVGLNVVLVAIGLAFWLMRRRHKRAASAIDSALDDSEDTTT